MYNNEARGPRLMADGVTVALGFLFLRWRKIVDCEVTIVWVARAFETADFN